MPQVDTSRKQRNKALHTLKSTIDRKEGSLDQTFIWTDENLWFLRFRTLSIYSGYW